jgi:hypothetical protein
VELSILAGPAKIIKRETAAGRGVSAKKVLLAVKKLLHSGLPVVRIINIFICVLNQLVNLISTLFLRQILELLLF